MINLKYNGSASCTLYACVCAIPSSSTFKRNGKLMVRLVNVAEVPCGVCGHAVMFSVKWRQRTAG